jgi:hypothetical protein
MYYFDSTQVSTEGCLNVDDFIEAVKKEMTPDLDTVAVSRISISFET